MLLKALICVIIAALGFWGHHKYVLLRLLPADRNGVVEQGETDGPAWAVEEISQNRRCQGREAGFAEANGRPEDQERPVLLQQLWPPVTGIINMWRS